MERHYTYFHFLFPGGYDSFGSSLEKLVIAAALGASIVIVTAIASSPIRSGKSLDQLIVPGKFSLFSFFDLLVEKFVSFHDGILGKENRKYVPFCGSVFFFVLFSNLLGLIPGMPAITTTAWVNVGLALVVFVAFNYLGIREHGLVGYLKHFAGPIWWLAPLFFVVEIFSTCLRIVTLNLRLYWNISADHLILGTFTDMVPVVPIVFYGMGTFVCFMQAFIFTVLTMIYILLATQHGEEEHHH